MPPLVTIILTYAVGFPLACRLFEQDNSASSPSYIIKPPIITFQRRAVSKMYVLKDADCLTLCNRIQHIFLQANLQITDQVQRAAQRPERNQHFITSSV